MTKQEAIELLEPLVESCDYLNVTLVMERRTTSEICGHYGTWNDFDFTCTSYSYWRQAEVECETDTEDFHKLLVSKALSEMDNTDFSSLSLGEADDADTDVRDLEWTDKVPDDDFMDENDFSTMDLYWESEITDCDIEFDAGSIVAIKFVIDDIEYTIDE